MISTVEIPDGVQMTVDRKKISVSGPKGQIERQFVCPTIKIEVQGNELSVSTESSRKAKKALAGTIAAHARNMVIGVTKGYEYALKSVYKHFPMVCKVEGNKFLVDNFIGEKFPRTTTIPEGVEVKVNGPDITVTGINKELVGITISRIEQSTRLKSRDRRVFQDGIYVTKKGVAE